MAAADSRQLDNETEQHFRRNMVLNVIVDTGFGFGLSLLAVGTIIATFLHRLGASNTVIGLAPGLYMACTALPQLVATHATRHLREKKRVFVTLHLLAYLPWIALGLLTLRWAEPHPQRMTVALLTLISVSAVLLAAALPLWGQLLPRLFPDRRRGIAMGLIVASQGIAGIVGGLYAAWTLAARPYPVNFAALFLTAGAVMLAARSLHLLSRESVPEEMPSPPQDRLLHLVGRLWNRDRRLRRFVLARYIYESGSTVGSFFAVYALARFDLPDRAAGQFTLAMSLGLALVAPWLGRLGDRRGYRRVMGWAMVTWVATTLLIRTAPHPGLLYLAFALGGIAQAADSVAYVNLLVEMSDERLRGYYIALGFAAMAPLRLSAPLFWGSLSDTLTFALGGQAPALHDIFGWGLALQGLGWLALLAMVDDPRRPGRRIVHWRVGRGWPRVY